MIALLGLMLLADVTLEPLATNTAVKAEGKKGPVTISAERADYDRKEGVILFDGRVVATDPEVELRSQRLYLFLDGTNQLKRIVVLGGVVITNGLKNGACEKAQYNAAERRVVMYGGSNAPAVLVDESSRRSEIKGRKITFWIGSEQVEVADPIVTVENGNNEDVLPALGITKPD